MVLVVKSHLQCRRYKKCGFDPWVRRFPWRRDRLSTPVFLGFPCDSAGKESACNVGELGSIPGLGRSSGVGNGNPLQYSCLENPKDWGAWWAIVHGVTKSQTWPSNKERGPLTYTSVSRLFFFLYWHPVYYIQRKTETLQEDLKTNYTAWATGGRIKKFKSSCNILLPLPIRGLLQTQNLIAMVKFYLFQTRGYQCW